MYLLQAGRRMKIELQAIKRDLKFKAVIYGFLAATATEWIIGGLAGAALGAYGVSKFSAAYELAGRDISKFNQEAFLNSVLGPTQFLMPILSIVLCVSSGILGGYIAGRKAQSVERINASVVGILLLLSLIATDLFFTTPDTSEIPKEILARWRLLGRFLYVLHIVATVPLTIWGGAIAAKKNAQDLNQPVTSKNSEPDTKTTSDELEHFASVGDAPSQYKLAKRYAEGEGVKRELSEAVKWFLKAAEQGNPDAQSTLGRMYFMGEGVNRDNEEAFFWYSLAAKSGKPMEWAESMKRYLQADQIASVEKRVIDWQPTK
jgi:hypothetical protein